MDVGIQTVAFTADIGVQTTAVSMMDAGIETFPPASFPGVPPKFSGSKDLMQVESFVFPKRAEVVERVDLHRTYLPRVSDLEDPKQKKNMPSDLLFFKHGARELYLR